MTATTNGLQDDRERTGWDVLAGTADQDTQTRTPQTRTRRAGLAAPPVPIVASPSLGRGLIGLLAGADSRRSARGQLLVAPRRRTAAARSAGTRSAWPGQRRLAPATTRGSEISRSSRPDPWASSRAAWVAAADLTPLPPCAATARFRARPRIVRPRERIRSITTSWRLGRTSTPCQSELPNSRSPRRRRTGDQLGRLSSPWQSSGSESGRAARRLPAGRLASRRTARAFAPGRLDSSASSVS